ncbi:hypothetical protein [Rhizobium sullae]|uniref:hypothetical protein n=1 Tax=Rhizobium sullae TaxID=50338 RepID=UPI001FCD1AF3|nr:hypothetical protein [Rhizobium sullae]
MPSPRGIAVRTTDFLRALYRGRKPPAHVPLAFLSRKWRRRVRPGGGEIDFLAWEVAVLVHLRDRLRAGDIWVDGSRAWRSFEDYLLPRDLRPEARGRKAGAGHPGQLRGLAGRTHCHA